jgi:hypothetical protein
MEICFFMLFKSFESFFMLAELVVDLVSSSSLLQWEAGWPFLPHL